MPTLVHSGVDMTKKLVIAVVGIGATGVTYLKLTENGKYEVRLVVCRIVWILSRHVATSRGGCWVSLANTRNVSLFVDWFKPVFERKTCFFVICKSGRQ